MATLPIAPIDDLAGRLAGELITLEDPNYDAARSLWNGMIDKYPVAIARCADAADVAAAVRFAADYEVPFSVRGGGHNVAGTALADGGLVIDLSAMRGVRVDGRTVHVQGGATWADVDAVTAPLGLAAAGGVVSETGVAGLALSGGVSHQRRRDGMTIDNLVSAEVVLADGRIVHASDGEHPDLFWALRGGGGNFGVVTSFEFRLHELGPVVFGLNVAYPLEDAARVLAGWRDLVADAPDELSTAGLIWSLPAMLPEPLAGHAVRRHRRHVGGRPRGGRARHPRAARARDPAARHERADRIPRVPALARPVLPERAAPLLEGAVPRRVLGRRRRHDGGLVQPAARERHAGDRPPLRRRDVPRRRRRRPRSAIAARSGC